MRKPTPETLRHLYHEVKLTDLQIANRFNLEKYQIGRLRNRYGIETLPRWNRRDIQPTEEQSQVLIGGLLGDASIPQKDKSRQCCFEIKHSVKQKEYLLWKFSLLENFCSNQPKPLASGQWRFRTVAHPYFSSMRTSWYPRGRKKVPEIKKLSALGLAIWYMDDGRNGSQGLDLTLCTCCFTRADNQKLGDLLLTEFEIDSRIAIYAGYCHLRIGLDSRRRFLDVVAPYIHPSMQYKLDDRRLNAKN
jgi:recombination protein RecA